MTDKPTHTAADVAAAMQNLEEQPAAPTEKLPTISEMETVINGLKTKRETLKKKFSEDVAEIDTRIIDLKAHLKKMVKAL